MSNGQYQKATAGTHPMANRLRSQTSESFLSVGDLSLQSMSTSTTRPYTTTVRQEEAAEAETIQNKKVAKIVGSATALIFLLAFILIAVTLKMTPQIDEKLRKETEDLLRGFIITDADLNITSTTSIVITTADSYDEPQISIDQDSSQESQALALAQISAWTSLITNAQSDSNITSLQSNNNTRSTSSKSLSKTLAAHKHPSIILQKLASGFQNKTRLDNEVNLRDGDKKVTQPELNIEDHDEAPLMRTTVNSSVDTIHGQIMDE